MSPTLLEFIGLRLGFVDLFFGILACSSGDRWTGTAGSGTCPNHRPPAEARSHRMDSGTGDAAVSRTSAVRAGWMGLLTGRAGRAVVAAGTGTGTMTLAGQWTDARRAMGRLLRCGPRRPPESSPPSPGRSSSASDHRASRPSAAARAGICRLPRNGRGPRGLRRAVCRGPPRASPDHNLVGHAESARTTFSGDPRAVGLRQQLRRCHLAMIQQFGQAERRRLHR